MNLILSSPNSKSSNSESYHDETDKADEQQILETTFQVSNENISFKQKIHNWSIKHISCLNNKMLSDLLRILKTEHDEFPLTATTFLQTKISKNIVRPMLSSNGSFGSYIYFGLEKVLKSMIDPEIYTEDVIEILVNIDGVQIYKNSKQQFWPILIMVHNKKYIVKPQVVAIYLGESTPKSPTQFLDDFITEFLNLITNKITLDTNKAYDIKLLGFVCDTPARAFIKCVKSHVAFYACERCTIKGQTVADKNKRIYTKINCEERNKQSFETRRQPEHHLDNEISPLLRIPEFDPVKSVVLDSMHLFLSTIVSTLEANFSRFVTKCRWIIEQVFGRLRMKFKTFAIPAHNSTLIRDYQSLLIAFALLNLFHEPILSDKMNEDIAIVMKSRLNIPNRLQDIVENYNLSKVRAAFLKMEYVTLDNVENNQQLRFPQLSLDDLYNISLGPYQIQNAISYYAEHQNEGIFLICKFQPNRKHKTSAIKYNEFDITIQDPVLIKAYMKSRYRSGKHHHIFVLVDRALTGRDN
ncbi:hypothetical protein ALC62_01947 [Cyphomyrmex costatus]|uniref:Uncharacterized protein n=1 Tax=Cyphomyrmex costatus TaxID=456900 RepID=A0A151INR4_9HYME|nr:hypothetical protein ALC62_01947 [Cyphomyrmex costatus]